MKYCIVNARFSGENGSMGYMRGAMYALLVKQHWFGKVSICAMRNNDGKLVPITDSWCPYDSLELFLRNWKVMEVVSDGRA